MIIGCIGKSENFYISSLLLLINFKKLLEEALPLILNNEQIL